MTYGFGCTGGGCSTGVGSGATGAGGTGVTEPGAWNVDEFIVIAWEFAVPYIY